MRAAGLWRRLFCDNTVSMVRQTVLSRKRVKKGKKRGPPATGKGTLIGVRLQPPDLVRLDEWAAAQDDQPSRPEAIRRLMLGRLIEQALAAPKRGRKD
jgi:hypothetical protein